MSQKSRLPPGAHIPPSGAHGARPCFVAPCCPRAEPGQARRTRPRQRHRQEALRAVPGAPRAENQSLGAPSEGNEPWSQRAGRGCPGNASETLASEAEPGAGVRRGPRPGRQCGLRASGRAPWSMSWEAGPGLDRGQEVSPVWAPGPGTLRALSSFLALWEQSDPRVALQPPPGICLPSRGEPGLLPNYSDPAGPLGPAQPPPALRRGD